jgi:large subunit ribosomal protein L32
MAVPKRRQSNQKTRSRRAHDFHTPRQLTFGPTCGKAVPTHRVCGTCGHYKGRAVIATEE